MFLKSSWLPGAASALRRRLKATAQSGGSAAPIGGLIGQKEGPASVLILHDLRPRPPAQHRLAAQGAATAGSPWWRKAGRNVFPAARMMSSPSDQGDEADKQEGGRQASRPLVESANAQGEVAADCQKPTKRFRCIVEYDGTDFSGFQSQGFKGTVTTGSNGIASTVPRTVQGEIEEVILKLEGHEGPLPSAFRVQCAGRTDAGTHATGQVIAFDLVWRHDGDKLISAFNHMLPQDISLREAREVGPEFHPRFGASFRRYNYIMFTAPHRSAIQGRNAWHIPEPLDVEAMDEAIKHLLGSHDFTTFGTPPNGTGHCIRELTHCSVERIDENYVKIDLKGRSFLYKMVRNIVATLRAVGRGKIMPGRVKEMLEAKDRGVCYASAPARGLTLTEVGFWGEDGDIDFMEWRSQREHESVNMPAPLPENYGLQPAAVEWVDRLARFRASGGELRRQARGRGGSDRLKA